MAAGNEVGTGYVVIKPKMDEDATRGLEQHGAPAGKRFGDSFAVAFGNLISGALESIGQQIEQFIAETVNVGKTFEASMSNVAALSGATAEELELLEQTARDFGSTTQFSASEAADALGYMALAGWDAKKSSAALGGVLNLAAASGMGLAQASDMVTDYLSAFGMEAEQSSYFADMLAYAQANSNTSAQALGEAYRNCAASLNAAGQDVETTTSLLAMMANQGYKGSEAGTALTATMRDITNAMENGQIAVGNTSIAVMDSEGNFRDLTDILRDVEAATNGMGDAERSVALSSTFTADSMRAMNLILNSGVDDAASFEEALRNCEGSAADMAEIMNSNLVGDTKKFQSALAELQLTIYDAISPALRFFAQTAASAMTGIKDAFTAAGDVILDVLSPVIEFVEGNVIPLVMQIADAVIPIVMGIGAVVSDVMGSIFDIVGSVLEGVTGAMEDCWPYIQDIVELVSGTIKRVSEDVWPAVSGFVTTAGGAIKSVIDAVFPAIKIIVSTVFATIQAIAEGVWPAVSGAVEVAGTVIGGVISGFTVFVDIIRNTFNGIKSAIEGPINLARDAVRAAIEAIKGFFRFEIQWPNIPMPHFYISPAGWGIGDLLKGSIPSLGIDWYAEGGFVDGATLIGAGEAGPEMILPRQGGLMDDFAETLADKMGSGISINGPVTVVANDPQEFMAQLTAFAARTRAQYA